MTTIAKTRKSAKEAAVVVFIARYQFKSDPRKVAYLEWSSDHNTQYQTYLFDGKATSCSCPSRKPCKHMLQAEAREAERTARKNSEQELARIDAEVQAHVAAELAAPRKERSEMARIANVPDKQAYQAEAIEEKDRIMAEFVLSQAEVHASSVMKSNDDELAGDPWEGLDQDSQWQAWRNYELGMSGLSAW